MERIELMAYPQVKTASNAVLCGYYVDKTATVS
jgi:hypothetical protein